MYNYTEFLKFTPVCYTQLTLERLEFSRKAINKRGCNQFSLSWLGSKSCSQLTTASTVLPQLTTDPEIWTNLLKTQIGLTNNGDNDISDVWDWQG